MILILKHWRLGLIAILAILLLTFYSLYQKEKKEATRQSSNVEVLNSNYTSYKAAYKTGLKNIHGKDSIINLNAAKINSLVYTSDEFKRYRHEDLKTIEALNLKIKNVQNVTNVGTQTSAVINTKIQYVDSTKCLNYSDQWTDVSGCFKGDSILLKVVNRDSLTTVVSKIPKHKFLWWSWGVKAIKLDILSKNPNTSFTYLKYVELK